MSQVIVLLLWRGGMQALINHDDSPEQDSDMLSEGIYISILFSLNIGFGRRFSDSSVFNVRSNLLNKSPDSDQHLSFTSPLILDLTLAYECWSSNLKSKYLLPKFIIMKTFTMAGCRA